jgi:hypothetical protein
MNKQSRFLLTISLILIAALALTACGKATPVAESTGTADASDATTAAPAAATASCPAGTWALTDFSAYMNSIEANTAAASGSDITMTSQSFTGSSKFDFGSDGTVTLTADHFQQKFTMTTSAGGSKLNIDIALNINGTSKASYTVDGDKISLNNQDNSGMTVTVDTMGTTNPIDGGLLGQAGNIKLYQFACPDANTLTLKVIATKTDLAPLTLTRVQ